MSCGNLISVPLISSTSSPWPGSTRDKGSRPSCCISVVDDRSGVAYQEYHCAYGEAVEVALQFLFNAMAPKADARFPFGGRPAYLYADNGPVTRSHVFRQVMDYLGIEVRHASASWPRWPPHHRPGQREGGAAVSHGERGTRNVVPLS